MCFEDLTDGGRRDVHELADAIELQMAERGIEPAVRDALSLARNEPGDRQALIALALEIACGQSLGDDQAAWARWLASLRDGGAVGFGPLSTGDIVSLDTDGVGISEMIRDTTSLLEAGELSGTVRGQAATGCRRSDASGADAIRLERARRFDFSPVGQPSLVAACRVVRMLGSGGMARVHLIEDGSGTRYALKTLLPEIASGAEFTRRFEREGRLALAVDHPHVIKAYEIGSLGEGRPYVATEYCEGGSLQSKLRAQGPIGIRDALRWLAQAAEAVAHIWNRHRAVHRDISPANLLLDRAGNLKIADLGLAKRLSADGTAITGDGVILGTPHYLSPEQATPGANVDCRADLYALGATFYHLLSGRTLFHGSPASRVLIRHVEEDPRSARAVRPDIPDEIDTLLMRLLSKKRSDRPGSGEELASTARTLLAESDTSLASDLAPSELTRVEPATALRKIAGVEIWGSHSAMMHIADAETGRSWVLSVFTRLPVRFGRSREAGIDLPMRLYPIEQRREDVYQISRAHGQFDYVAGEWRVTDLGSHNGSWVRGSRLTGSVPHLLTERTALNLGEVLDLECEPLCNALSEEVRFDDEVRAIAPRPALVIYRRNNRRELIAAALRDRLAIGGNGVNPEGAAWPEAGALWRLDGGFWWQPATESDLLGVHADRCDLVPLGDSSTWRAGALELRLSRLTPDVYR